VTTKRWHLQKEKLVTHRHVRITIDMLVKKCYFDTSRSDSVSTNDVNARWPGQAGITMGTGLRTPLPGSELLVLSKVLYAKRCVC
jgi:hypothetical protein